MLKKIHYSATPIGTAHPEQRIDATLVATSKARRVRIELHWDTCYSKQTDGAAYVWTGAEFSRLFTIHAHDLTTLNAGYENLEGSAKGDVYRSGRLDGLLARQVEELAAVAFKILEK